jgi:uncharacterized cupredoxin-like copper-binding protein
VTSLRRRAPRALPIVLALLVAGCDSGARPATPPISPGSSAAPREVNIVLKDWIFLPDPVDVVPGESVLLHVVNGGLEIHELVIGDQAVQDAWEAAELATVGAPPGPTPVVSVPPDVAGIRVVVPSGGRVDVTWAVPASAAEIGSLILGCHIPGHWDKGMRAGVVVAGASPGPSVTLGPTSPSTGAVLGFGPAPRAVPVELAGRGERTPWPM